MKKECCHFCKEGRKNRVKVDTAQQVTWKCFTWSVQNVEGLWCNELFFILHKSNYKYAELKLKIIQLTLRLILFVV